MRTGSQGVVAVAVGRAAAADQHDARHLLHLADHRQQQGARRARRRRCRRSAPAAAWCPAGRCPARAAGAARRPRLPAARGASRPRAAQYGRGSGTRPGRRRGRRWSRCDSRRPRPAARRSWTRTRQKPAIMVRVGAAVIGRPARRIRPSRIQARGRRAPTARQKPANQIGRRRGAEIGVRDVLALGNHQHMHRRRRMDVVEGERELVLVDLGAGRFAAQDPGEDVVAVVEAAWAAICACATPSRQGPTGPRGGRARSTPPWA